MHRGDRSPCILGKEREMQHVDMEVEDVELVPPVMDLLHHGQMRCQIGLEPARIESDGLVAARDQLGLGVAPRHWRTG